MSGKAMKISGKKANADLSTSYLVRTALYSQSQQARAAALRELRVRGIVKSPKNDRAYKELRGSLSTLRAAGFAAS